MYHTIIVMTDAPPLALMRFMQLVSPSLPVGAYAYSQGLEFAVQERWVHDRASTLAWLKGVMSHSLYNLDLPLMRRMYHAWQTHDEGEVLRWSRFLSAARETKELLAEDRQIGTAMARLLADLDVAPAANWVSMAEVNWPAMFSLAACSWQIPLPQACHGYLWAWCENQVTAAIKLVPLGQTDGQNILQRCAESIADLLSHATAAAEIADEDIGQLAPALAIASALHENQYTRLFRS